MIVLLQAGEMLSKESVVCKMAIWILVGCTPSMMEGSIELDVVAYDFCFAVGSYCDCIVPQRQISD